MYKRLERKSLERSRSSKIGNFQSHRTSLHQVKTQVMIPTYEDEDNKTQRDENEFDAINDQTPAGLKANHITASEIKLNQ